ncbi:tyrosine-type recombinase/integrase [Sphingopyxis sp. NJF-3]
MTGYIASIADKPSHGRTKDAWKALKPFWENVEPDKIDPQMCKDYRAIRNVGDATVRLELMKVSTALNWAMKSPRKYITDRGEMWLPPKSERKTRHLTRSEFDRFLEGMVAPHAKLYALIGLFTCARPGAILDLTWDRVDFMRGQIDLNPAGRAQTAKRRPVVPIGNRLMQALQEAYAARTSIYVVERAGRQIGNIKKAFQAASERSSVHATPYTLRHTGAVWAAEAGIPMSELAQMLGHDDDRTTQQHYARYSPGYLKRVADAIEQGRISA